MAQDVTRSGGRHDEPRQDKGTEQSRMQPRETAVQQDDDLKNVERLPRLGNEDDMPDSDALGG